MQDPNSRVTPATLAAALRCSAAPPAPERDCDGCPYYVTESVPAEYAAQLGDTWTYCDVGRMIRDAADMIESTIGDPGRFVMLPVRPVLSSTISSMLYIIDDEEIYEDTLCTALVGMSETGETNVTYETLYDQIGFEQKDIGKTVFLSREEAEKALEEERKHVDAGT